jgi:hypothetical protein
LKTCAAMSQWYRRMLHSTDSSQRRCPAVEHGKSQEPPPACCQWGCLGLGSWFFVSLMVVSVSCQRWLWSSGSSVCGCLGLCTLFLLLIQWYAALLCVRAKTKTEECCNKLTDVHIIQMTQVVHEVKIVILHSKGISVPQRVPDALVDSAAAT